MFTVVFFIQLLHTRGVHFPLHLDVRITGNNRDCRARHHWKLTTHNSVQESFRDCSDLAYDYNTWFRQTVCKSKCWSTFKCHKGAIFAQFLVIVVHKYYNWSTVLPICFYWMIFLSVISAEEFSVFLVFFHIDFYIWTERKKEYALLSGRTWKARCPLQRVTALVVCSDLKELRLGSAPWHSRKLWCCYSEF